MILIKTIRNMRMQMNYDNLNHLLSSVFAADIEKTLWIHDFLVKNKNLV